MGKLLNKFEAAEFLGTSVKFVTRWKDEDKLLPHVHVGGRLIRYPQGWLELWLLRGPDPDGFCPKGKCGPTKSDESDAA